MSHELITLVAGGTVGRDHRTTSRNYQDAYYISRSERCTVAVVADGCGSGAHSEVGASLGVRLVAQCLLQEVAEQQHKPIRWQRVQQHVLSALDVLARQLGGSYRQAVEEYFLFTLVGVVLTNVQAIFFALGDGVIVVNGTVHTLGPFPGNMPPYLGYGLLPGELMIDDAQIALRPVVELRLSELNHFLIGSDGVFDLMRAADKSLPGMQEVVGGLDQFWTEERYVGGNPELVSRRLRLCSRDWPKRDPEPGLLPDDTTLIVGRTVPYRDPGEDSW